MWMDGGSIDHILGADQQGRDILSRIIHGARITLIIAGAALLIGGSVGVTLGMISGYYGGIIDEVIMRIIDVKLALPLILVALVVVITIGQSFPILVGILAINAWSGFARQVRAEALKVKEMEYVSLARIAGASDRRILIKHIFPGVLNTVIVIASLQVGGLILTEAILSFLGAGIPPPTPAWGSMVSEGRQYLGTAWWLSVFPGTAIFLTVFAFNFIGDWLRDQLDPNLRQLG
jgi:peptide/nickel transport system permease protein